MLPTDDNHGRQQLSLSEELAELRRQMQRERQEREQLELHAAAVAGIRQAVVQYLVHHSVSPDLAWQIATGNDPQWTRADIHIPPVMDTIYAVLDDCRYAIAADLLPPFIDGSSDDEQG